MKVIRRKAEFPFKCQAGCGRAHGGRYHQFKGGPATSWTVANALHYDAALFEPLSEPVNLRAPPHICAECLGRIKKGSAA